MSTNFRDDNECQNCGYTVDRAYCSKCGQKNTETRQPFHHLFTHFIEDLTHYDGAFWKTISHLLFSPARLTKEYLIGKRQTYVPPVKLYIFISFITFFLPAILPSAGIEPTDEDSDHKANTQSVSEQHKMNTKANVLITGFTSDDGLYFDNPLYYSSVPEMDSIENAKPSHLQLSPVEYKLALRIIHIYKNKGNKLILHFIDKIYYNQI